MARFSLFRRKKKKSGSRSRGEPKLLSGASVRESCSESAPRPRSRARKKQGWKAKLRTGLWFLTRRLAFPVFVFFVLFLGYMFYDLPDISKLGEVKKTPSIVLKSEDGIVIGSYGDVYADYVPYEQFPKYLIDAVVATEDRRFFDHMGIDSWGLARAMWKNLRAHRLVEGGSTITQQVAKNVFLTPERKIKRKLQEMVLALKLESRYSKKDILTIYLNRVYMGAGNYGVDAASHRYFGHSVRDVTLNEAAILVGLLKAPSRYAPTSNPDLSEKRATQVLLNMQDAGYLTETQVAKAKSGFQRPDANYRENDGFGNFYFSDWVVSQLREYIGDTTKDIVVTTTLKADWQQEAEKTVEEILEKRGAASHASQAALVSLAPDGAVRVMVGGRDYRKSQFNRAVQAQRQPGSAFKLFVFLAALENGFTPESQVEDKPITIGKWQPKDYAGKYQGWMTLRQAFAQSINTIAVQLSEAVGREQVIHMAQRLGITSDLNPDPSIALGSGEVTLFDMTKAYAHLASGGKGVYPYAVTRIETADGNVLYERAPSSMGGEVLGSSIVGMMNNMLIAVTTSGTGRGASIGRPIAGKTGTTSDYRDAWFVGFTPQLATGVWVGNDDTTPMKKVTGGNLPAAIWRGFMAQAMKGMQVASIPSLTGMDYGASDAPLPWLAGDGGAPRDLTQQVPAAGMPSPREQQTMQTLPPGAIDTEQELPPLGGYDTEAGSAFDAVEAAPAGEPAPAYDATPSIWERVGQ